VELVRRIYDVEHDWSTPEREAAAVTAFLELLDPAIVYIAEAGQPSSVAYRGMAEIRRLLEAGGREWQCCRYRLEEAREVSGDRVLATGRVIARTRSSASRVNLAFAHVWTVRGGRAIRLEAYDDLADALTALRSPQPELN
jgi:ketosteroid isomerase-like protein